MKHYLLNHQPQKGLQAACAQQGQAPTCNARGKGHISASPKTLTRILLVLLTMLLLPNAAWSVEVIKTIKFNKGENNVTTVTSSNYDVAIPVTVNEIVGSGGPYIYDSNVRIRDFGALNQYRYSATNAVFTLNEEATTDGEWFIIRIPGNYPANPTEVTLYFSYDNASINGEDDSYSAKIHVGDNDSENYTVNKNEAEAINKDYLEPGLTFSANGPYGTERDGIKGLDIYIYLDGEEDLSPTFTIEKVEMKYNIDFYDLSVAGIPVTGVNKDDVLSNGTVKSNGTPSGDGTVSFTPAEGDIPATLTLSNANLEITTEGGAAIESSLDNLVVNLVGENTITSTATTSYAFKGNGSNNTITFQTDDVQNPSKIQGDIPKANVFNNIIPSYQGLDLAGDDQGFTIGVIEYGLTIGETAVTSLNAKDILNNGKVSFTPADGNNDATLTLSDANINGGIVWNSGDPLVIALNGENNITTTTDHVICGPSAGSSSYPELTFKKANGATSWQLTLTHNANDEIYCIYNFTATNTESGLYYIKNEPTATVTSTLLGGGSGTSTDPFLIKTAQHLQDFASYVNKGIITNEYIKLNDGIDCSDLAGFETIGNSDTYPYPYFKGTFDGNEKSISNLSVKGKGLFYTDSNAPIKITKLTLDNLTITGPNGSSGEIGAIASNIYSGDEIEGCVVKNSHITCETSFGNPWMGGIVGANDGGTITNCIVENTEITASVSNSAQSGPTAKAAGIVCNNSGSVSGCQVKGNTIVTASQESTSDVTAGAILCINSGTLSNNTYEYTVKTRTKGSGEADYTVKQNYDQRGIATSNDIIGEAELAGTKKVTISATGLHEGSDISLGEDMGSTYCLDERDATTEQLTALYVLPGSTISLDASSEEGYKPTFTLSNSDVIVTPTENKEDDFWKIKYEFSMPEDDVTATIAFARDLGSQLYTLKTEQEAYTYTGEGIEPSISLTISTDPQNPVTLTKGTDYEILKYMKDVDGVFTPIFEEDGKTPKTPVDAGSYQVYISGIGSYTGEAVLEFSITKATTDECIWFYHLVDGKEEQVLTVEEATYGTAYDAPKLKNPLNLAVTLSCNAENGSNGTASDVATIDDEGNITILKAGTVYVYAVTEGNENYEAGEVHYQLDIEKGSLENVTITEIDDQVYTGTAIEPELTVTTPDGTSVTTDDYVIGYTPDNTNVGQVTITLTAKEGSEKFTESTTTTFNIIPPTPTIAFDNTKTYLNTDKIAISIDEAYATSSATAGITNTIYYSWDENPVTGTEYSEGGVAAQTGTLTAWVSATKSGATYESEKTTQAFTVKKDIASCTVTLPENATYTGAAFVPVVEAPNGTTATTLTEGTDYTVSYQKVTGETATDVESMIDAGTYKITITGIGNYGGTKEISKFQIAQASLADAAISKLIVGDKEYTSEVDKVIEIPYTGEAIQPEVVVVFNDGTVTVDASEYTVSYGENNTEISNETAIASVTVTSTNKNFTGGTSTWREFKIVPAPVTITAAAQTVTYNAQQQAYTGASVDNENAALVIAYYTSEEDRTNALNALTGAPTDAGTYYVSVTLNAESLQHYTAEPANVTFKIAQLDISEAVITLDNEELTYNGEEQSVNVTNVMAGDIEVPIDCYEVSGNTEKEASDYTLTVTAKLKNSDGSDFKNNFKGNAEKAWKIKNRTVTTDELGLSENQSQATYYSETEDLEVPEGVVAYIITGVNGNNVVTQRIRYIPKRVAVFVEQTTSTENPLEVIPDASELPLKGTAVDLNVASISGGTVYVLYKGEFVKSTTGTIPAKRCYLLLPNNVAAGTRAFGIIGGGSDGSTAIKSINDEPSTIDNWYDMGGHRIEKPTKTGIYIKNGKKVAIK